MEVDIINTDNLQVHLSYCCEHFQCLQHLCAETDCAVFLSATVGFIF